MTSPSKVLICGAGGFIGRNMVERFVGREDSEVFAVYHERRPPEEFKGRANFHPVWADLRVPAEAEKAARGMDVVLQAAATTSGAKDIVGRPYLHVTDNAVMNSLLLRACFEADVRRVVFFSCTVMYPEKDRPVKETDFDGRVMDRYFGVGWTKVYVEKLCEFYARIGNTRHTAIRHSNVYGPHDKFDLERSHVFGATVAKVMGARDGKVTVWGDGTEARDLLYVDDLLDLVEAALERQESPFELVNAGSGEAVPVAELVRRIIEASGRDLAVEYDRTKPSIPFKLALDCSKAKEAFGWTAKTPLAEGIRRTLAWYRDHAASPPA